MTILSKDTHAVLKLNLGEQGTRRITLKRLWNEETNTPSYTTLVALIRDYKSHQTSPLSLSHDDDDDSSSSSSDVLRLPWKITYTDEDGDIITISSDEELVDAFEQFINKDPPVLRATVTMTGTGTLCSISSNGTRSGNGTSTSNAATHHHIHTLNNNNNNLRKLEQLKAQKRDIMRQMAQERRMMLSTKMDQRTNPPPPTTNTTNTTTTMTQTDLPVSVPVPIAVPTTSTTTTSETKECPSAFIHGRHTCDGCFTTPIIGIRYHAVNLPDYDLCQNCVHNYKGSDIAFKPEQLDRDVPLQDRWRQRFAVTNVMRHCGQGSTSANVTTTTSTTTNARNCNRATPPMKREDIRTVSHNVAANVLDAAIKGVRRVGHEIMEDAAFQEAVRRSLLVSKPSKLKQNESLPDKVAVQDEKEQEEEKKEQEQVEEVEEKENRHDTIEVESVSEESVAEAEVTVSPTQSLTTANILIEPLDELILKEETPLIHLKIEETMDDIENVQEDLQDFDNAQVNETGATILNGEDITDEIPIPQPHNADAVERGEWQVLDNNGEDITQRDFARATQMLGSALYQSSQTESNMSSLTSVPTIGSSNTNIPPVVLAMWRDELEMLRQFGFSDDQRNAEILERLQAANIGSDRDEKVSVERAANVLLNEKQFTP